MENHPRMGDFRPTPYEPEVWSNRYLLSTYCVLRIVPSALEDTGRLTYCSALLSWNKDSGQQCAGPEEEQAWRPGESERPLGFLPCSPPWLIPATPGTRGVDGGVKCDFPHFLLFPKSQRRLKMARDTGVSPGMGDFSFQQEQPEWPKCVGRTVPSVVKD